MAFSDNIIILIAKMIGKSNFESKFDFYGSKDQGRYICPLRCLTYCKIILNLESYLVPSNKRLLKIEHQINLLRKLIKVLWQICCIIWQDFQFDDNNWLGNSAILNFSLFSVKKNTDIYKLWSECILNMLVEIALYKKGSFPLRISSLNVTKSARNCRSGQIYWRKPHLLRKTSFFVQC